MTNGKDKAGIKEIYIIIIYYRKTVREKEGEFTNN